MSLEKPNNIYFIKEQDGSVEKEFKNAIRLMLTQYQKPVRAYLTQIKYETDKDEFTVAVCFKMEDQNEKYILQRTIEIFKLIFRSDEHVDILFLSEQQEINVRRICCPFFVGKNYQISVPDFYLVSSEGYGLSYPAACFKRKRFYGEHPDGYLLCDLQCESKENYRDDLRDVKQIIFAARHKHYSLFPIDEWPAYVHVAIPLVNNLEEKELIVETDIKLVAWGELQKSIM